MKVACFDLDGVLCNQTSGDYENAIPNQKAISLINSLHEKGHRIIVYTSRFMGRNNEDVIQTHKEGYNFTLRQLRNWGVKFHDLYMGKPRYDILIDDKSIFYIDDWDVISNAINIETDKKNLLDID